MSTMKLREFAGACNRAKTIYVPVHFANSSNEEKGYEFLPIPKSTAKMLCEIARDQGIDVIQGVHEENGCLYLDGPSEEDEVQKDEEGEEEETEEETEEEGT